METAASWFFRARFELRQRILKEDIGTSVLPQDSVHQARAHTSGSSGE